MLALWISCFTYELTMKSVIPQDIHLSFIKLNQTRNCRSENEADQAQFWEEHRRNNKWKAASQQVLFHEPYPINLNSLRKTTRAKQYSLILMYHTATKHHKQ